MAAIEISFDSQSLTAIKELVGAANALLAFFQLKMKADVPTADNWLTASHLCEKYDISRATLTRRVKTGKIERKEFDDGVIRYRLAGG